MVNFINKYTLAVVILAIVALMVQGDLISRSLPIIIAQIAALALAVSARAAFRSQRFGLTAAPKEGALIQRGPYRVIRHPMYTAALILIWASILGHLSWLNAAIGVVVTMFALLRVSTEEKLLRGHYSDYAEYSSRTKRMIPFIY
jgi:protein-S-isoprenylcysteine O-methyltransferase Ste14